MKCHGPSLLAGAIPRRLHTNMNTPPPLPKYSATTSLFHKAATASILAVPLSIAITMFTGAGTARFDPETRRVISMVIGIISGVILIMGLVAGVIALFGMSKYGTKRILWKAVVGTVMPVLLILLAIPAVMGATKRASHLQQGSGSVDELLAKIASNLNSKVPIAIDADTSLVSVTVLPDKTIQYNYSTTTRTASDFPQGALKEALLPSLVKAYQSSADMAFFRENKVKIIYSYTDRDGQLIDQFTIEPDTLKN